MLLLPFLLARDPQYAWDLTGRVVEPQSSLWVRNSVLAEMARHSPDRVLALAATLEPTLRRQAEEVALRAWPVEQALAWCANLSSAWKRSQLEKSIVKHLVSEDPVKAAAMLRAGTLPVEHVGCLFPMERPSGLDNALRFARAALAAGSRSDGILPMGRPKPVDLLGRRPVHCLFGTAALVVRRHDYFPLIKTAEGFAGLPCFSGGLQRSAGRIGLGGAGCQNLGAIFQGLGHE